MPNRYSIAQRTPVLNSLFAGMACAITLALAAGPAFAEPADLERVEVSGRVIEAPARYDVHAACADLDGQLQSALSRIWEDEGRYGEVKVQFVVENGEVNAVNAKGISHKIARSVRNAVNRLDCGAGTSTAAAQIYRFSVDFVDPNRPGATQMAGAAPNRVRVALLSK
ncbi:hypothetical protein [Pelomonas sp. Root1444]|uniref:hypothetical protein n=1 Tax=Pelomonas sp. Root1444 TaxID=1736464 RepID=UPI000702D81C|nr:hypothetical protein [Pelomonas sp. Root1444]KQY82871.1 hypothetical protein ASD35_25270 [Pelomonas sp. Root1444]